MSVGVLVLALALVPAAIAWACNPQAHISLNGTSFSPGQSITVYGSYFTTNADITVSGTGRTITVRSSAGGAFTASGFAAPSSPGSYVITASRPTGGFASVGFQVVAPAQAQQPSGAQPQPAQQQPAPPTQADEPERSFSTPGVAKSERQAGARERGSSGGTDRTRATPRPQASTPAPAAPAQPVFSGTSQPAASAPPTFSAQPSTPAATTPASPRSGARERSTRSGGASQPATTPSQQTAFSDVWSGFQPGRTASLTSASAGAPDGGPGSQLAWGIGLLAVGLFALVGGLAYTEARRRRVA